MHLPEWSFIPILLTLLGVLIFIFRKLGKKIYPAIGFVFRALILVSIAVFIFIPPQLKERWLSYDEGGLVLDPTIYWLFGIQVVLYIAAIFGFAHPFVKEHRNNYFWSVLFPLVLFVLLHAAIFTSLDRDRERYERIYYELGGRRG